MGEVTRGLFHKAGDVEALIFFEPELKETEFWF